MFERGWRIGSIGGVPITLDSSWVWIAIPITYSLYVRFAHLFDQGELASLALALFAAVLFFGSILVHELAHAGMARARSIPVYGIRLLFWGGATEVPADRGGAKAEFLISAVGPASNAVLAILFWLLSRATHAASPVLSGAFGYVGWVNVLVTVLNLLPGYPLDGGQMLRAGVWHLTGSRRRASRVAGRMGIGIGALLGVAGAWFIQRGQLGFAIWLFFIGWFLIQAARGAERREELREALSRGRAADAMRPPPAAVPEAMSLSEVLDRFLRGHEEEIFPVVEAGGAGRVIGVVSFRSARRVGAQDPLRPARDGMVPIERVPTVQAETPLDRVVDLVGGGRVALVLEDGRLVGQVAPSDVVRWAGPPPGESTVPARPDRPS